MITVITTASVAFLVTYLAIPAIIKIAKEKKLYDLPDARKLHTNPIASLGGIGIFLGFFLSTLLTVSHKQNPEFQFFFAAAIVIFFLGLKDDILIITATKKFIGQMAAAAIVVHLGNIQIHSLHGFLGVGVLPLPLSYLITYITIIVVVNAYNLIDGVDGLAGSLGILTMSIFGAYFYFAGLENYALLAMGMGASMFAFLFFNFSPAKIFMGDSGSLLLGLVNAILVIKFITVADSSSAIIPLTAPAAIGFSILAIPLLDTLRVFSIRIAKGRSPFVPDRNHIHHLLLDCGLSHRSVTLSCVGLNASFIALCYFERSLGTTTLFVVMMAVSAVVMSALMYLRKPGSTLVIASSFQHVSSEMQTTTKIVPIKTEAAVAEQ